MVQSESKSLSLEQASYRMTFSKPYQTIVPQALNVVFRGADLLALNADQNMPYDICEDQKTLEYIEQAMANKGKTIIIQKDYNYLER